MSDANTPLYLHWWKGEPNFGDALSPLIVADACGVPDMWLEPKGQSRLKYLDYAASVGRRDLAPPVAIAQGAAPRKSTLNHQDGINACRAAVYDTFPSHLKAAK